MSISLDKNVILECCACSQFATLLASRGPFSSTSQLIDFSRSIWWHEVCNLTHQTLSWILNPWPSCVHRSPSQLIYLLQTPVAGWLQAFAAHPRIGDMESLKKKFDAFTSFSQGEQATAASSASDATLQSLADWNAQYETKFGHIFIICAAGKSANFMLNAVKTR